MVTEEICGRFGPFDGSFICISTFLAMGLPGAIIERSASLFGRFPVNFVNLKHNKQMTSGTCPTPSRVDIGDYPVPFSIRDVQRFERQG